MPARDPCCQGGPVGGDRVRAAARAWLFAVLGAALLTPFALVGSVLAAVLDGPGRGRTGGGPVLVAGAASVPVVFAVALVPAVRSVEVALVRQLLGSVAAHRPQPVPAAVFATLHLVLGGIVGGATVAGAPAAALVTASPWVTGTTLSAYDVPRIRPAALAAVLGLAGLLGLVALGVAAGRLLGGCAAGLLRPDPAHQVAALEESNRRLTRSAEVARQLHDSVGHALAVVSVQAGAARRLLAAGADPSRIDDALGHVTASAASAQAELDDALGSLRRDDGERPSGMPLVPEDRAAALAELVAASSTEHRPVRLRVTGNLSRIPDGTWPTVIRVVRESLTNAVRHGTGATRVSVTSTPDRVSVEASNTVADPAGTGERPGAAAGPRVRSGSRRTSGTGLPGLEQTVGAGGGTLRTMLSDGCWTLEVELPGPDGVGGRSRHR